MILKNKNSLQVRKILLCILLSFSFTLIETVAAFHTNSLALFSDATHNLSDGFALMVTLFASLAMNKPISARKTYGNYRAGILAAFFNALLLVLFAIIIFKEAWIRYFSDTVIHNDNIIIITALIAFFVNVSIGKIIYSDPSRKSLNLKAALIHVISDAVTSLGVVVSGIIIYFTKWYEADALISVVISISMLITGFRILLQAINILMEATPKHLKIDDIISAIRSFPNVKNLHDLHVWSVSDQMIFLTCHIELPSKFLLKDCHKIIMEIRKKLASDFDIKHSTIQVEMFKDKEKSIFCEIKHHH